MKTIKRILGLILIVAIVAVLLVIWQGYEMYSDAVAKVSIEEKAAEIMEQDHYTTYEQLPETYVNAVIAAEDQRYRYHKGFDIISTARAAWPKILKFLCARYIFQFLSGRYDNVSCFHF